MRVFRFLILAFLLWPISLNQYPFLVSNRIAILILLGIGLIRRDLRADLRLASYHIILLFWSTIKLLAEQSSMTDLITSSFTSILIVFSVDILNRYVYHNSRKLIYTDVLILLVIQSFIVILGFFVPEVEDRIDQILHFTGNILPSLDPVRSRGLMPSAGAMNSIALALGGFSVLFLRKDKELSYFVALGILTLSFVAVFFVGRSGLIILILVGTLLMWSHKLSRLLLIITSIISFSFVKGFESNTIYEVETNFEKVVRRNISEFQLLLSYDRNSRTSEVLSDMIIFPNDIQTFLFGDSSTWDGKNRVHSDIGVIRYLWYGGILFTVGIILSYVYISFIFRSNKFLFSIPLLLLFFELKEPVLINQGIFAFILVYAHAERVVAGPKISY